MSQGVRCSKKCKKNDFLCDLCFNCDYIPQIRRVKRRLVLVLIDWLLGGHLRAVEDGALALVVLNLVEHALQAFVLFSVLGVEHIGDDCCLGDNF